MVSHLSVGFFSPIDSLKFFKRHKFLLVLCLAPHIAGLWLLYWILQEYVVFSVLTKLSTISWFSQWNPTQLDPLVIVVAAVVVAIAFYGILGIYLINVFLSPFFDYVAEVCYEESTSKKLPKLGLRGVFLSMGSELSKLFIWIGFLFISFLFPFFGLIAFFFGLWFAGFQYLDRTLLLKGLDFPKRFKFCTKYFLACCALGIWTFIPFVGSLLSFLMVTSGALVVSHFDKESFSQ